MTREPRDGHLGVKPPPWSEEELAILRGQAHRGRRALVQELPGRSKNAISLKAADLGIAIPRDPKLVVTNNWRGRIPVPQRAHPFVRRLVKELNHQMMTIEELSQRSGVGLDAISRWRYRSNPNLVNLLAALNALGLDLSVTRKDAA